MQAQNNVQYTAGAAAGGEKKKQEYLNIEVHEYLALYNLMFIII